MNTVSIHGRWTAPAPNAVPAAEAGKAVVGIALGVVALIIGLVIGASLSSALDLPPVKLPGGQQAGASPLQMLACVLLVAGVAPLAAALRGSLGARWLSVTALIWVSLGLMTAIEAAFFTTVGGTAFTLVVFAPPAVLLALMLAFQFHAPAEPDSAPDAMQRWLGAWSPRTRVGRLLLAWLAFPAVYVVFGSLAMLVAPWAQQMYLSGAFGLTVPALGTVLAVQAVRGALLLAVTLPVVIHWSGTPQSLVWRLGLALFVLMGLFGLMPAYWLPVPLRVLHCVEILLDSVVYAWLISLLLLPPAVVAPQPPAASGSVVHTSNP